MESLVLQPIVQTVYEKLADHVLGSLNSLDSFKKDVKKLQYQLMLIQGVIQDAEERQVREENVKLWLNKLQSVAYDADDFLEKLHAGALRRRTRRKLRFLSPILNSFASLFKYSELKEIQKTFGDLADEISLYKLRNDVIYMRYNRSERDQTGSCIDKNHVFGRDKDMKKIVEMLLLPSLSQLGQSATVNVLPIVGMGGVGKTTLAQLVYTNNEVGRYFDLKIWISVGGNFNVRKLIRDILEYVGQKDANGCQLPQLGILQSRLQESLRCRKYLLVLDDVWNKDEAEWSKLREPLSCGDSGSKILVTTRSQSVAALMGTYPSSYSLKQLSNDDSWIIFRRYAFPKGGEEDYPILTEIGSDIIKKCGGIPLAAKVLGSLLCPSRDEREWSNVLRSEIWDLQDSSILSALSLSYNHLSPHQKRCFSYCSVFPKNYEIHREKLIHQWIAEGLIPSHGDGTFKTMEDIGSEFFDDLVGMSLFEGVSNSKDGRITVFKIHSLIHDLALSVSKPIQEELDPGQEELFISAADRRASVVCRELSPSVFSCLRKRKLRTFHLIPQGNDFTSVIPSVFKRLRHLRVLNLSGCGITVLPESLGGLEYLKYLDISNNLISKLPETTGRLINLQTLDLSSCHDLACLPVSIVDLINLRHLKLQDCISLKWMPPNIENLKKLQTLPVFIPTEAYGLCGLSRLRLRGELKIKHLENGNFSHGCLDYKQLHSLTLSWGDGNEGKVGRNAQRQNAERSDGPSAENVLSNLIPNRDLKVLRINDYLGATFPLWMNKAMLPTLTKLVLVNCRRCEALPTLGQLPFLKSLRLQGMDEVVQITEEFYGNEGNRSPFVRLRKLVLEDFPNLRSWKGMDSVEIFPCLGKLSITKCPRLVNMPMFTSLVDLDMHECSDVLLRSASVLNSLSTLVIDRFLEACFISRMLFPNNTCITSLTISSCPKLTSLPESIGLLTDLRTLNIRWCETLEDLPQTLLNLSSLETLEIIECPGLISLRDETMQGLKCLRSLSIENCLNLISLPQTMQNLTALEHLTIMYCPSLVCLPDVVQEFQALHSLNIINCLELASLPSGLQHVRSLRNLEIRGCPKLEELPDWMGNLVSLRSLAISDCENIKLLPGGLKCLKDLQHISIIDCPELETRCQNGTGEDWSKISHIPYKYVGSSILQQGEAEPSISSS